MESQRKLSVTTDHNTATPDICKAETMSSRNSLTTGDFPIPPAHQSILNQMAQRKELYRPQNAFLRKLLQRTKTHFRVCQSIATPHLKIMVCHLHSCWWVGALEQWYQLIDVTWHLSQWIVIMFWKRFIIDSIMPSLIMTSRVEICKIIHAGRWIRTCLQEKRKTEDHHCSKWFSHDTKDRGSSHEYTISWLACYYKTGTRAWEASAKSSDIRETDKKQLHTLLLQPAGDLGVKLGGCGNWLNHVKKGEMS